jgi:hypothetical protein
MRLVPVATSFQFDNSSWLNYETIGAFYPHFNRLQNIDTGSASGPGWFQPVSRLSQLRSLDIKSPHIILPHLDPSNPVDTLGSSLRKLYIHLCRPEAFEALVRASKSSLRQLRISISLLPHFFISSFPNLTHLSLGPSSNPPSYAEIEDSLATLVVSKSLVSLTLSPAALALISQVDALQEHLPQTCYRVNLEELTSLDSAVSVLQKVAGDRISRLGLPRGVKARRNDKTRMIVAGVRAIAESVGVEIIWY